MRRDGKEASWLQQAAVAVAYAIGFCVLREWSFSHWLLFVGLRLGALLLVPYRYWPALVVGELLPLAFSRACAALEGPLDAQEGSQDLNGLCPAFVRIGPPSQLVQVRAHSGKLANVLLL